MPARISDWKLLDELERLAEELEKTPTANDMDNSGEYSSVTYQNHFDSWNDALREVELKTNTERDIKDSELLDELQRLAEELGQAPRKKDMKEYGRYSTVTYYNYFKSWNDAIKSAGLEPYIYPVGKEHSRWNGGGNDYYGPNWTSQRRQARERDDHECQDCGVHEDKLDCQLDVHHITPLREFQDDDGDIEYENANVLYNLVSLCSSCHRKREGEHTDMSTSQFKTAINAD